MSLQHAILGLLSYKPTTGYDIKQIIDRNISYLWSAKLSQIYRDLGSLEGKGYVTTRIEKQEGRPDKKIYSVTDEGKKTLQDWMIRFPNELLPPIRDEFCIRILFGSSLPVEEIRFQLNKFIKEVQARLEIYRKMPKEIEKYAEEIDLPGEKFFWDLALQKGVFCEEAQLRWARECLVKLEKKYSVTHDSGRAEKASD
jgi:DNA-binding PadR family transcriptional regulator